MNILIKDSITRLENNGNNIKILPHQLATLDFLYTKILKDKENVLLFHKMGSGKTIVSLLLAIFSTKEKKKNIILLPNTNIKNVWKNTLLLIKQFTPFDNYNTDLILFKTKKEFIESIEINKKKSLSLINLYRNTIFIIDEAHNFFGNNGSDSIIYLQQTFQNQENRPLFLLVTGSPITNTLLTLKDLLSILCYEIINENDYMIQDGNKIFNYVLNPNGIEFIKTKIYDKVSYFDQEKINIPPLKYQGAPIIELPIVPCKMSSEQTNNYYDAKKYIQNEMFLKYLLILSFVSMGSIQNIQRFEELIKSKKYLKLTNNLYLNNGKFYGDELKTLNNSCKLKYFITTKLYTSSKREKSFIYFSNSNIGGRFLKDVLNVHGIQEYGEKKLDNFICYYCSKKRTCEECKPLTYIIVTSIYLTNIKNCKEGCSINNLLDIYNSPNNKNGEEIYFLFGSKIISESYTLKETREIWFFTIPDSLSEISQIIARCLRTFSYQDLTIPVKIFTLVAIPNDFNINLILKNRKFSKSIQLTKFNSKETDIDKFIENLMKDENYPYDIKKILYVEIKSKQTNKVHEIFKNLSINKKNKINPELIEIYLLEILRRISYNKYKFNLIDILEEIPEDLLDKTNIPNILQKFINDGIIINNKVFHTCILIQYKNYFYTRPIKIEANDLIKIQI